MAKYRGAVIGLGWMGLLYGPAARINAIDRPTPDAAWDSTTTGSDK